MITVVYMLEQCSSSEKNIDESVYKQYEVQ